MPPLQAGTQGLNTGAVHCGNAKGPRTQLLRDSCSAEMLWWWPTAQAQPDTVDGSSSLTPGDAADGASDTKDITGGAGGVV